MDKNLFDIYHKGLLQLMAQHYTWPANKVLTVRSVVFSSLQMYSPQTILQRAAPHSTDYLFSLDYSQTLASAGHIARELGVICKHDFDFVNIGERVLAL